MFPVGAQRLANRARQDVTQFQFLYEIIKAELATGEHAKLDSCTKGLLWLKRWASVDHRMTMEPRSWNVYPVQSFEGVSTGIAASLDFCLPLLGGMDSLGFVWLCVCSSFTMFPKALAHTNPLALYRLG